MRGVRRVRLVGSVWVLGFGWVHGDPWRNGDERSNDTMELTRSFVGTLPSHASNYVRFGSCRVGSLVVS